MARYVTTTLPYVNASPHLGHALEFVQADAYVRTLRAEGEEVFFNIGTDEHGTKVFEKAALEGKEVRAYVDEYAKRFRTFADMLGISYSAFIRTTDEKHIRAAQEFWRHCEQAGDIYKATYDVKYCVGCELEKTDSDLVDGVCPIHPNLSIEFIAEENYYFRFSKYQDAILALYRDNPHFVMPEERLREITSFVSLGLKDFSISRRKEKLPWGVPVPGDDEHVMYVWFDALVNYVSTIGWPDDMALFETYWPVVQFAGKDNLRQQSAMWQAMLLSAGLPSSKQVFIHGFITSDGQKMSKSLGNVISPADIVARYGVDALRYYLLRHVHPFEDSDVTLPRIAEVYEGNLVNGLGNFVARVMTLAETHLSEPVILSSEELSLPKAFVACVESFRFHEALDMVFAYVQKGDVCVTEREPYRRVKSDVPEEKDIAKEDIRTLVRHVAMLGTYITPLMPVTAEKILRAVKENKKPENLFPRV